MNRNVSETNGLVSPAAHHAQFDNAEHVCWTDKRLDKITRLRMLTERGHPMLDVSYCQGELGDGSKVWVDLPFSQLPRRRWKTEIVSYAKEDRVYAKGLGVFSAVSVLY